MNNQEDQISSLLKKELIKSEITEKNEKTNKVISVLNRLKNGTSNFNLLRSLSQRSAPKADLDQNLNKNSFKEALNQGNSVNFITNRVVKSYMEKIKGGIDLDNKNNNDLISPNSKGVNNILNSENESTSIEKNKSIDNITPVKEESEALNLHNNNIKQTHKINLSNNDNDKNNILLNLPPSELISEFNFDIKKEKEFLKRKRSKRINIKQMTQCTEEEIKQIKDALEKNPNSSVNDIARILPSKTIKQVAKQFKLILAENLRKANKKAFSKKQKTKLILKINNKNNKNNNNESRVCLDNWSIEEDNFLINWVNLIDEKNWTKCAKLMKKRTAKQCKERFFKVLLHKKNKSEKLRFIWTPREELILLLFVKNYGTCWSKIIKIFSSKSEFSNNSYSVFLKNTDNDNDNDLLSIRDSNEIKNKFYSIIKRFVQLDFQEKSQIYKQKEMHYNRSNKVNYDSDDSFTLQGNENANFKNINKSNDDPNKKINEDKDAKIKFESLWFYINNAIIFYKNYFDEKTYKEIFDYFTSVTNDFEGEVSECLKEFNAKLRSDPAGKSDNSKDFIKINLCDCCTKFLRNHIKKKIILKFKQANSMDSLMKDRHLFQNLENAFYKKYEEDLDKKFNLIEKIPSIYKVIHEIKKGFAFS